MMETTNTTTGAAAVAAPNYIKDFFSVPEHDYKKFFNDTDLSDDKTGEIIKKIRKLQEETADLQGALQGEYAKKYSKNYEALEKNVYFKYSNRKGDTYYYSVPDGAFTDLSSEDENSYYIINLYGKSGEATAPRGYCYELASVIGEHYNYNISGDNSRCRMRPTDERIYPFFDAAERVYSDSPNENIIHWRDRDVIMGCLDAQKFINTLYGVNRNLEGLRLSFMAGCYRNNKSFETILKTAPDEVLVHLLGQDTKENKPVYKLLGLEKDVYNTAVALGNLKEVGAISWAINDNDTFHKNTKEWFALLEKCSKYEHDLSFYDIDFTSHLGYYGYNRSGDAAKLLTTLAKAYKENEEFSKNYSFGKFVDYVVKQTIDQAYNSIKSYLSTLLDYLRMCRQNGAKPTLYSSQLSLTHAIAVRNHKIHVSCEEEEKLKERYLTFSSFETSNYKIIAPKGSEDIKKEGDQLDHCVASYIKRVIDGECLIYFLRHKDHLDDSLITIEVENNCIVQARGMHNKFPDETESMILNKFARDREYECSYSDIPEDDKELANKRKEEEE